MPEKEQVTKKCPFNGSWCEKGVCALWMEMAQEVGGMRRVAGMCAFIGTTIILSEMNMRLIQQGQASLPRIQLPSIGRG